jgi:hypothetical protein
MRIGHDDPFLNGVEDRLEKTFLLGQTQKIILHLLRPNLAEPANQFFEKAGFHGISLGSARVSRAGDDVSSSRTFMNACRAGLKSEPASKSTQVALAIKIVAAGRCNQYASRVRYPFSTRLSFGALLTVTPVAFFNRY